MLGCPSTDGAAYTSRYAAAMSPWDVVVVGGGPAGLSAARSAATAGARTLVLEKAEHPRYKTCGGGLIGPSLRHLPEGFAVPARDRVDRATFTLAGGRAFTRSGEHGPFVAMVRRDEFDLALRGVAEAAGAAIRERVTVRAISGAPAGPVEITLAGGEVVYARTVVGADGSSGITARHVGVAYDQVDLGLEVELPVAGAVRDAWRGRLLIDWGPLPGSYGWVFPKDDSLTVGVIAARGQGEATKRYLRTFTAALGLDGIAPRHDSGHLTRCRRADSPLRRGQVIVAGDAAGLLEPWTREGISYALRSGELAGRHAATGDLAGYESAVPATLGPSMAAGRRLLRAFSRHPLLFHWLLGSGPGWRWFEAFCRGDKGFESALDRRIVRAALAILG